MWNERIKQILSKWKGEDNVRANITKFNSALNFNGLSVDCLSELMLIKHCLTMY